MIITAIVSRKGGVGKTATAQALGAGLYKQGRNVLMIDLDSQANLTFATGATGTHAGAMEVLTGKADIANALQATEQGDVLPGSGALAAADIVIDGVGKEYRLQEALEPVAELYDHIIIDTPAALGTLTVNALTAAQHVIIPVQADIYSLQGLGQLNDTIKTVRKYCNRNLSINGILVTRFNRRSILSRDMLDNLKGMAAQIGTRLYSTPIRECISIKESQAQQEDIFTYAPRSNGAKDYSAFISEFAERIT